MKSNRRGFTFDELISGEKPEEFIESAQPFMKLMMQYQCAMLEVQTKFEVLNTELSLDNDRNPIESISCRIKKPMSIVEKLKRKGVEVSLSSIEKNLHDVAGIRVICYFEKDVELLAEQLRKQSDLILVKEKDYITNPKPNGYRSFHMILGIQVYSMESTEYYPVEVQIRTIGMDFWASMEHRICYKQERDNKEEIQRELLRYAEILKEIEEGFEGYNEQNQNEKARLSHKTN